MPAQCRLSTSQPQMRPLLPVRSQWVNGGNCFFHIIQQKTEERCQDAIQKVRKRRGKERRRKGDKISKWVHWCCCQNLKFPQTWGCLQIINQPRLWIWIQIIQPLHCFSFLPGVSWNSYSLANLLLRQIRNSSGCFFFHFVQLIERHLVTSVSNSWR